MAITLMMDSCTLFITTSKAAVSGAASNADVVGYLRVRSYEGATSAGVFGEEVRWVLKTDGEVMVGPISRARAADGGIIDRGPHAWE